MSEDFVIEDIPVEWTKRGKAGGDVGKYPFHKLEIGQSFFVPVSDRLPNPSKSLATTVCSASKRFATQSGTRTIRRRDKRTGELQEVEVPAYIYHRRFSIQTVYGEGELANTIIGARVGRVPVDNTADNSTPN